MNPISGRQNPEINETLRSKHAKKIAINERKYSGAATAMLKSVESPSEILAVQHSDGPVYYRNSFEKRYTEYVETLGGVIKSGIFNLDPCFYNPALLENKNVTLPVCEIEKNEATAKSGSCDKQTRSTQSKNYHLNDLDRMINLVKTNRLTFY